MAPTNPSQSRSTTFDLVSLQRTISIFGNWCLTYNIELFNEWQDIELIFRDQFKYALKNLSVLVLFFRNVV